MMIDYPVLLADSAPVAEVMARRHCHGGLYGNQGCAWYHGNWQYFVRCGVVSTPWQERRFYHDALVGLPAKAKRVLVAGASDYAMLCVLHAALGGQGSSVEFTVVDCCETPLALNRWYAERAGLACRTHCSDILDFEDDDGFDLLCTHAFLGNVAPPRRRDLVRRWHALLRPGGHLVTINRVRPAGAAQTRFLPGQAEEFRRRVVEQARCLGLDSGTLAVAAERYVRDYRSWPLHDGEELRERLLDAGFQLVHFQAGEASAEGGPSSAKVGQRLQVCARRGDGAGLSR